MDRTFKCRYCKHSHLLNHLAGSLSNGNEISTALERIAIYEAKIAELSLRDDLTEERRQYKEEKWGKLLNDFNEILDDNREVMVCNFCWSKAKTSANIERDEENKITFNCNNCNNERGGRKYGLHIENMKHKGIDPRKWSIVCEDCYKNEVIPADYYCPRTSEGRSDYDIEKPRFDCLCKIPAKINYLTIDGETVIEILRGQSILKPSKKIITKNKPLL